MEIIDDFNSLKELNQFPKDKGFDYRILMHYLLLIKG